MNKKDFFKELKKELENNNISEIEDIIRDFEEHFEPKLEEGKTEEEITRKIGNPQDIANDYANHSINEEGHKNHKSNRINVLLLFILDIFVVPLYIALFAVVLTLGVASITFLTLGFSLIFSINIESLIPSMPYISSLIFGIGIISVFIVFAIGTIYMYLYVRQWGRVYLRWHKNCSNNSMYPSLSMHPKVTRKLTYNLKLFNMIGIVITVITFIIGYIVSASIAGSFEFWHVWNWFV
ncbi:MAG: DUF1700 domain-containing protein [Tenericutes bacterium]|nr:DUF1700 domain-containing protein [Mycoplasmatota bacterium]